MKGMKGKAIANQALEGLSVGGVVLEADINLKKILEMSFLWICNHST